MTVLKETIAAPRPAGALTAQPTGVRLLNILSSTGWLKTHRRLSTEQIVQLSAVVVCLDVLAQDIAKTTFRMYERLPNGGKREVEAGQHPIADLLRTEPNRFHTWYEFFEMVMLHLGLVQNSYVAKRQTSDGQIKELIPCMPARVTTLVIAPDQDPISGMGFYAYEVRRMTPHERLQLAQLPETFLEDEFIHFRGRMFDGLSGYSNIEAGARTFGMASELVDYQTRLFSGDGQMPGVFQMGKESGDSLDEEAFQRLRSQLAEASRKFREENVPIVLEEGMTFASVAMNAEQAQLRDARDAAIVDCARHFRIPPHKIMHLVNVKYENMETLEKSYVNDSLIPYCERIEQRMSRALLNRQDRARYFFQFDRREMLLNDMRMLSQVMKDIGALGAVTLDEIRQAFGYNELPGNAGKARLIPSTYNLVDSATNKPILPAGAQPAKDDGGDKKETDDA